MKMELEYAVFNARHIGVKFTQAQVIEILARFAKESGVPIPDKVVASVDVYDDRENFILLTAIPK